MKVATHESEGVVTVRMGAPGASQAGKVNAASLRVYHLSPACWMRRKQPWKDLEKALLEKGLSKSKAHRWERSKHIPETKSRPVWLEFSGEARVA